MKIGIIVDGVLIDKNSFFNKQGKAFFNDNNCFINEYAYSFCDMFNCNEEVQEMFYKRNRRFYYKRVSPEKGASEFTKKLKEMGNEIYLMASRKNLTDKNIIGDVNRLRLMSWLKNNKIVYDKIVYYDSDNITKDYIIDNLKLDYVIEDQIRDTIIISRLCNVIMYDRPYNLGYYMADRVKSFDEILEIIKSNNYKYEKVLSKKK